MFTSPDNHQHKALQAVLDHTTSSQNEEHAKSDLWNIYENPERPTGNSEGIFLPTCNKWTHCSPYILAQQVIDHSWPVRQKICARGALSWRRRGEGFRIHGGIYFRASWQPIDRKYFLHLKTKNFMNKVCLCRKGQFSNKSCGSRELSLLGEKV